MQQLQVNNCGYEVWVHHQAGASDAPFAVDGDMPKSNRSCRFCGASGASSFRKRAHLVPEGLGNKWLLSNSECDQCNHRFGAFESSLCTSIGPLLTIGGVKGKANKVRQTGLSASGHSIRHIRDVEGKRNISFSLVENGQVAGSSIGTEISFFQDRRIVFRTPAPKESFIPRDAYKGLTKIGLGLLPATEMERFSKLRSWIMNPSEVESFPFLEVGVSVGSFGNSPEYASVTLLRRKERNAHLPFALLIACCGSMCWQIDMLSDTDDSHIDAVPFGILNLKWKAILGDYKSHIEIPYSAPKHFDWSSCEKHPPIVSGISATFNAEENRTDLAVEWASMFPT